MVASPSPPRRTALLLALVLAGVLVTGAVLGVVSAAVLAPTAPWALGLATLPLTTAACLIAWNGAAFLTFLARLLRRAPLDQPGESVPDASAPGELLHVPPGTWAMVPAGAVCGAVSGLTLLLWSPHPVLAAAAQTALGAAWGAFLRALARRHWLAAP